VNDVTDATHDDHDNHRTTYVRQMKHVHFFGLLLPLSIWCGLHLATCSLNGQDIMPDELSSSELNILRAYYSNLTDQLTPLNQSRLDSLEHRYLLTPSTVDNRLELAKLETAITYGANIGLKSSLFPSKFFKSPEIADVLQVSFFRAGAYFTIGNYPQAIAQYEHCLTLSDSTQAIYALTLSNMSSAYNQLDNVSAAIEMLETAIDLNTASTISKNWKRNSLINLAGLKTTADKWSEALTLMESIDTLAMEPYWRNIMDMNRYVIFNGLCDFSKRDSVWNNHLSSIPFNELSSALHDEVVHQYALRANFDSFLTFRKHILTSSQSPLLDPGSPYYILFNPALSDQELAVEFRFISDFSKYRDRHWRMIHSAENPLLNSKIRDLELQLEKETLESSNYRGYLYTLWTVVLLCVSWFVFRTKRTQMQKAAAVDDALTTETDKVPNNIKLTLDELRTLGDAISMGRNVSSAMLVMKKLNVIVRESMSPDGRELASIDGIQHVEKLTLREKEILQLIASNFDPKEIARLVRISPEHVYNMRSKIRKKLELDASVDLEEWLQTTLKKNASN